MEVTHKSDYDTHAIIGGQAASAFKVIQSAEFITVLSSTLYSDQPLAVVREVIFNGWDAHKAKGIINTPLEITVNRENLVFRDFGEGIAPDRMTDIYCTYGGSTKKDSSDQTGGFGLGSKAPFSYSNHFTVTVHHKGTKTVWAISRGSEDTSGMPDARIIVQVPTTETGVEVSIPIKDDADVYTFANIIKKVTYFGAVNAKLNGSKLPTLTYPKDDLFVVTSETPPTMGRGLYVNYGGVVYPIPENREYNTLYESVIKIFGHIKGASLIFQTEPNSISITPSRESLSLSERTIETIKDLLTKFHKKVLPRHNYKKSYDLCYRVLAKHIKNKPENILYGLITGNKMKHYLDSLPTITNEESALLSLINAGYLPDSKTLFERKLFKYFQNKLHSEEKVDKKSIRFVKEVFNSSVNNVVTKHRNNILKRVAKVGLLTTKVTLLDFRNWSSTDQSTALYIPKKEGEYYWGSSAKSIVREASKFATALSNNVVIMYASNGTIKTFKDISGYTEEDINSCFGYKIAYNSSAKVRKVTKDALQKAGFQVIDALTSVRLDAEKDRRNDYDHVDAPKVVKPKKPKGYLKASVFSDTNMDMSRIINAFVEGTLVNPDDYMSKPEFYIKLPNKVKGFSRKLIPGSSPVNTKKLLSLFGDVGCVVRTSLEAVSLSKKGVPTFKVWIQSKLNEDFVMRPEVQEAISYKGRVSSLPEGVMDILKKIPTFTEKLEKYLGEPKKLNKQDSLLYSMINSGSFSEVIDDKDLTYNLARLRLRSCVMAAKPEEKFFLTGNRDNVMSLVSIYEDTECEMNKVLIESLIYNLIVNPKVVGI